MIRKKRSDRNYILYQLTVDEQTYIGLTVGRQGLISSDSAANTDARVIRVSVALDEPSTQIAARFTNLEVIARIDTTAQSAKPQAEKP